MLFIQLSSMSYSIFLMTAIMPHTESSRGCSYSIRSPDHLSRASNLYISKLIAHVCSRKNVLRAARHAKLWPCSKTVELSSRQSLKRGRHANPSGNVENIYIYGHTMPVQQQLVLLHEQKNFGAAAIFYSSTILYHQVKNIEKLLSQTTLLR